MLAACMILLCNSERTEFGKPHAYHGPMCASGIFKWFGERYFAGAAISKAGFLPLILRRDKHKTL
jgi:hypothetical protein